MTLKLLMVCWGDPFKSTFGTEIYAGNLARALVHYGHEVHIICGSQGGRVGNQLRMSNLTLHPIVHSALPIVRTSRYRRACVKIIRKLVSEEDFKAMLFFGPGTYLGYAVCHLSNSRPTSVYYAMDSMLSERSRSRASVHYSGLYRFRQETRYWALTRSDRKSCKVADIVLASSEDTARNLVSDYGADVSKIRVLYEGIPDDYSSSVTSTFPTIPTFMHVGGVPRKGTSLFLEALKLLETKHRMKSIGVITRSTESSVTMAQQLGVSVVSHAHLGTQAYKTALAACTALVCPSFSEGFCLPVVEAGALGKPVIASDTGSLPELVEDGETGFIVPVGDVQSLADRMHQLAQDEALRQRLGENARDHSKRFTLSRASSEFLSIVS